MTPEEEQEHDKFTAALRGETGDPGAADRLGKTLRQRRAQALAGRDEAQQMRVWKAIESKLPPAGVARSSRTAWDRLRFAQAAALVAVGIGAGWFLRPAIVMPDAESRLEFSYGDLERPRGSLVEKTVTAANPADAMRRLTDALISDAVAFELYSVSGTDDRRVLFALPANAAHSAAALAALGIDVPPGETLSLTFTGSASPR
jgi:hypothetical protein